MTTSRLPLCIFDRIRAHGISVARCARLAGVPAQRIYKTETLTTDEVARIEAVLNEYGNPPPELNEYGNPPPEPEPPKSVVEVQTIRTNVVISRAVSIRAEETILALKRADSPISWSGLVEIALTELLDRLDVIEAVTGYGYGLRRDRRVEVKAAGQGG